MASPNSEAQVPEGDDEIVALLTAHQLDIRHYVQSLMPGDAAAQDVAQQANLTVWRKRADFEIGTNFKAWAFSIARFEVLTERKKQARESRRLVFSEELEEVFAAEMPELQGNLDDRLDALRSCLTKLNPKHRDLVLHRYFEGSPLKEFAEEKGLSLGGLKVTLHRVRSTLLRCIESETTPAG